MSHDHAILLQEIDTNIDRLLVLRKQVIADELRLMRQTGKMLGDIIRKAASFSDPDTSRFYIARYMLPWRIFLSPTHFPCTLIALPDELTDSWDPHLLHRVASALQHDIQTLNRV